MTPAQVEREIEVLRHSANVLREERDRFDIACRQARAERDFAEADVARLREALQCLLDNAHKHSLVREWALGQAKSALAAVAGGARS